jgi:hypothetical protein
MIAEKHEPIDNQEDDFFDSDELMDEPVYGPVVELVDEYVDDEYDTATAVREETKNIYETITVLRGESEHWLLQLREHIYSVNDVYKSLEPEDNSSRLRLLVSDKHLSDEYVYEVKRYNRLLNLEEFLKFVLSTSIFDDGGITYEVNDHIKFVLKLERS